MGLIIFNAIFVGINIGFILAMVMFTPVLPFGSLAALALCTLALVLSIKSKS